MSNSMTRVMNFKELPSVNVPRSHFDLSHSHKTTFNEGELIPIRCAEVLPSDTVSIDIAGIVRELTPLFPVMDDCHLDIDAFYVPNRLVWSNWEHFLGEPEPDAWSTPTEYIMPQLNASSFSTLAYYPLLAPGSLADHLGLPVNKNNTENKMYYNFSLLPFRAYQLIWNEWYRDENLQYSVNLDIGDYSSSKFSSTVSACMTLRNSNRYHDYFSSCLPSPQKGGASSIPLRGFAPVFGRTTTGDVGGMTPYVIPDDYLLGQNLYFHPNGNTVLEATWDQASALRGNYSSNSITDNSLYQKDGLKHYPINLYVGSDVVDGGSYSGDTIYNSVSNSLGAGFSNLWADLSSAEGTIDVNDLRMAIAVQRMLELDARGGTRYREYIRNHFGCTTGDARVQVPEYLGHFHTLINMNQVVQTSSTSETGVIGQTGAQSKTVFGSSECNGIVNKTFVEHGFLMILATVRVARTYAQGLSRMWSRTNKYDYFDPMLDCIGEQPVYSQEIYVSGMPAATMRDGATPQVFGYQEAWADYRMAQNTASGAFRPYVDNNLSQWTYADNYSVLPSLSSTWIKEGKDRVANTIAVTDDKNFQYFADFYFREDWYRPMRMFSVPSLEMRI